MGIAEARRKSRTEFGSWRHAAHHRLCRASPEGYHRAPGLLRLGVAQISRDLALPYGDPILGQGPEIILGPRYAIGLVVRIAPGLAGPRRFFTVIHALCLLQRR